jgi:uncharacterized membrane protein (UPF0127 family)
VKKALIVALVVGAAVGSVFLLSYIFFNTSMYADHSRVIHLGENDLRVEVADTEAARERGLSGRDNLAEGSGMLFVFPKDDQAGIWMKEMKFSIDVIWLDASGTVITIAPTVSPDTYPQAFYPAKPARYILEVPAGFAEAHGVAEGDTFVLH